MATKINSNLKEQVEKFKKAAKVAEAARKVRQFGDLMRGISDANKAAKAQSESSK